MTELRPPAPSGTFEGVERRRELPTMDLWRENVKWLNQSGLTSCQLRYALTGGELTFFVRFEEAVPTGKLDIAFPVVDQAALTAAGWERFVLTLNIGDEGMMAILIRGRIVAGTVTLDVGLDFLRDIMTGAIESDEITTTNAANAMKGTSSLKAIVDDKDETGERRFARTDDDVTDMTVESMIGLLSRYLESVSRSMGGY